MPEAGLNEEASELEALLHSQEPAAVLDAILGSTPSGAVIARTPDGKIVRLSDYAADLLGRPKSEVEGRFLRDEVVPIYDMAGRRLLPNELPLSRALLGETVGAFEYLVEAANRERIPCVCSAAPIRNWCGEVIGAISSIADLRPYKSLERGLQGALAQRDTMYRELTHRVKNHLQIMTALVALEARNPARSTKELAEDMKGQLRSLAAVYKGMDRAEAGEGIEARAFVEQICQPYGSDTVKVEAAAAPDDLTLSAEQAGPVGMLLNEAVCNSRKYAFPGRGGHIHVSLRRLHPGRLRLEVADDGVGWGAIDPSEPSHGLDLMRLFAKQMHGELELGVHRLGGVLVAVELPESVETSFVGGRHSLEAVMLATMQAVLASSHDAVITLDADDKIVLFNPAAELLFGVRAAEVIGGSISRFVPQDRREAHERFVRQYRLTGESRRQMGKSRPISGLRANGEEFPMEAWISRAKIGGDTLLTVVLREINGRQSVGDV